MVRILFILVFFAIFVGFMMFLKEMLFSDIIERKKVEKSKKRQELEKIEQEKEELRKKLK